MLHKLVALVAINVICSDLDYNLRVIKVISKKRKGEHSRQTKEEKERSDSVWFHDYSKALRMEINVKYTCIIQVNMRLIWENNLLILSQSHMQDVLQSTL